jgi:GNAT superfamily N-acetyltransferase
VRYAIAVENDASEADKEFVRSSLREFNRRVIGYRNYQKLNLFLRHDSGKIAGGLLAATLWNWLMIDFLWLDESIRGQGYGRQLMRQAEAEAISRECQYACLDTIRFQAPGFYQKPGYAVSGRLENFPAGQTRHFLSN